MPLSDTVSAAFTLVSAFAPQLHTCNLIKNLLVRTA